MRIFGLFLAGLFLLASAGAQGTPPLFEELARTHLPRSDDYSSALAVGDVNGDGHPDLVIGSIYGADRLYFGDGEGGFVEAPAGYLPANVYETRAVALADVNGNGHLDLVKGVIGQNRLYLNDGQGRFRDATPGRLPVEEGHTHAVALADVTGNGHLDLVAGNLLRGNQFDRCRLYFNDGKGYFYPAPLPTVAANTRAIVCGDVDGDGHVDLIIAIYAEPARLLLNDGKGGFSDATAGRLQTGGARAAALADLNGNGHLDLILSGGVYFNDGRGFFQLAAQFPRGFTEQVDAIAVGDVDGDRLPDFVLGRIWEQDQLYLNRGNWFADVSDRHLPQVPDSTSGLALIDVNGNGHLDLVKAVTGPDRVYLNDGKGRFSDSFERVLPEAPGSGGETIFIGDIDGDGWPDLAIGLRILLDQGFGTLRNATTEKLPASWSRDRYPRTQAWADVDGDGLPDLLIGMSVSDIPNLRFGYELALFLNQRSGPFQEATATHLPALGLLSASITRIQAVDVDGDGHLDLIVATLGDQDRLLLNDGQGRFSDATAGRLPARVTKTLDIAVADVDGDGHLDLIFGDFDGDRLYLGDGKGNFRDATAGRLPAWTTNRFHALDATGNGAPDLIALDTPSPQTPATGRLRLLVNDGKGHFTEATGALPALSGPRCLHWGDLTGNGAVDLAVGTERGVVLLENDGQGRFRDVTSTWLPGGYQDGVSALALFDRDGDGDLDLFVGSRQVNENRFFTNLRRQLHAPRRLQVGVAFPLEIWGRPGEVAHVLVGGTPGDLELFPFGRLRLGTSGLFTAAFVPIVQEPRVVLPVRVPADPALRGLEVRFQALMIDPGAVTRSRFTGVLVEKAL